MENWTTVCSTTGKRRDLRKSRRQPSGYFLLQTQRHLYGLSFIIGKANVMSTWYYRLAAEARIGLTHIQKQHYRIETGECLPDAPELQAREI